MSIELIGRDAELARVESLVERAATGGAALAVVGSAGIGKTALWRAGVALAGERGVRVLATRCVEVEMPIPLGHLADLVGDVLDEVADELPPPQRTALAVGLGLEAPDGFRPDWLALARATLTVVTVLARQAPVLVAVDDVQWLDPASSRVLTYALRRAAELPVGVLLTVRTDAETADPLALADTGVLEVLRVGPLSIGGLQHLVRTRLGAYFPRPTLARIHEASGGNPMFALEFARLAEGGPRAPTPLAVPRTLEDVVAARLERLPLEIWPLLEAASVIERPTATLLAAVLEEDVDALVELAIASDALVEAGGDGLAFAHPLLKAAAYFRIAPARRRALHRALSELAPTLEARGRHAALATVEPDSAVAELVAEASEAAAARGALHAAAELAAEAGRIEPDPSRRAERLLDAAAHLVDVGEFAAARELLEPMLADGVPDELAGRALLVRAESEIANRPLLVEYLERALAVAEEGVRWQALTRLAQHGHWVSGDARGAVKVARDALVLAAELDEPELVVASDAAVAYYEAACGMESVDVEAAPAVVRLREPWWSVGPGLSRGSRLMWAGRYDAAREVFATEHSALVGAGREARVGYLLVHWAELEWRAGRWSEAESHAGEATDLLGNLVITAAPRALLLASRGDEAAARSLATDMLEWCEWLHDGYHRVRAHWFLALLELSLGDPAAAAPHAETAYAALEAGGIENPGFVPVLPDLIECRLAADDRAAARAASDHLRRLADAVGTSYADALAHRGAAQVAHASGDTQAAIDHARRAIDRFASPFDAARTELLLGDAHRRAGERRLAAEAIGRGAELFGALGAHLWRRRAETELRRASPRARDRDELTAAEERVAALVAAGRANKEVAAELYTTVATVEAHLTRIYRKLGVRSRSELARGVADGSITLAEK